MTVQFWSYNPIILFNKNYIFELWPLQNMGYEQKLNAITRLIILLSVLGFILTRSVKFIVIGVLTLLAIFILFKLNNEKLTKEMLKEGFQDNNISIANRNTLDTFLKSEFQEGNKKNPFSNVLLTEIMDNPDRLPAPPCFNPEVEEQVTKNVKNGVQFMNPNIENTNKQLYSSLWDNFELDNSNRSFYSMPSTRVENDQGAFGKYLYGDMPSSKESGAAAAQQRDKDSYRYTLY